MFESFMMYMIQVWSDQLSHGLKFCEIFGLSWCDRISHSLKFYEILNSIWSDLISHD